MAVVRGWVVFVFLLVSGGVSGAWAQSAAPVPAVQAPAETKIDEAERPLPDIPALMRSVEANQRTSEAVRKNYIFHSVQTEDHSDGHGGVKKSETMSTTTTSSNCGRPLPGSSISISGPASLNHSPCAGGGANCLSKGRP